MILRAVPFTGAAFEFLAEVSLKKDIIKRTVMLRKQFLPVQTNSFK